MQLKYCDCLLLRQFIRKDLIGLLYSTISAFMTTVYRNTQPLKRPKNYKGAASRINLVGRTIFR